MDPKCTHLTSISSDAATLCNWMLSSGIRTVEDIDTGVQRINFVSTPPQVEMIDGTRGNNVLEAGEIFSAAIELLETEEISAFAASSFTAGSFPWSDFVSQNTSLRVPWLFTEHPGSETVNTELMAGVASRIQAIKNKLAEDGLLPNTLKYNAALARKLYEYISDENGLGVSRNPLGMVRVELSLTELLTGSRVGDCTELSVLYFELCRIAGLDARIAQVTINNEGEYDQHMCVTLRLDPENPDDITFADLQRASPFSVLTPREWVDLPDLDVAAYFRIQRGVRPPLYLRPRSEEQFRFKLGEYQTALTYDENLPLAHYNIGKLYFDNGSLETARRYFERVLQLYPAYPLTAEELGLANQ
jgi:tetratricopeptide (TPR) repeat protein